jgi:periplasmic protein CpxP/Spy
MKKLLVLALLAISLSGFAQDGQDKKGGTEKMLAKMTTELSLTADQQKQLMPILEEQAAIKKDNKENPDHKEDNKAKIKELGKKINAILTPEQIATRKAAQEKAAAEKAAQ